jgi:hypothetical protein
MVVNVTRYWFVFERSRATTPSATGYGVTAFGHEDALQLLSERIFRGKPLPAISQCVEHVDISQLDPRHVLPNIGNPIARGIWFPQGY